MCLSVDILPIGEILKLLLKFISLFCNQIRLLIQIVDEVPFHVFFQILHLFDHLANSHNECRLEAGQLVFEAQFVLGGILGVLLQELIEFELHLGVAEHALLDKFVEVA